METRNVVGIYDRPHSLKRRRIWLPIVAGVAALAIWLAFFVVW